MRIIKILFKIFIVSILLVAIIIAGIAVYMKFFGKSVLENALSSMLGSNIKFEGISINLEQYTADFKGFSIPSEIGFDEKNIFRAENFSLALNKKKFEKEKKIIFERIIIRKGVLNIERNREGFFNIAYRGPKHENGVAYADEGDGIINIYNFAKSIKELYIQDSVINFKDYYVPRGPFTARFDNLDVTIITKAEKTPGLGIIPMKWLVNFKIPGRFRKGDFKLDGDAYVSKDKVDMYVKIYTGNIDLMQFLPYFNSYTPFSFNEGLFSSETNLAIKNNSIDSKTAIVFHKLKLLIDSGMENARFLEASVNRLVPYLTSGKGEIIFDFVIKGPLPKPRIGLGPHVKFAIGMLALDEMNKILQQLQNLRR